MAVNMTRTSKRTVHTIFHVRYIFTMSLVVACAADTSLGNQQHFGSNHIKTIYKQPNISTPGFNQFTVTNRFVVKLKSIWRLSGLT